MFQIGKSWYKTVYENYLNASCNDKHILVQSSNLSARIMSFFSGNNKIVNNLKIATIKHVIIHLSKFLKFIFRKSHCVTFLVKKYKVSYQNMPLQFDYC